MVYLLLGIFCSAVISIGMRLSDGKVRGKYSMLAVNYLICGLLGAYYADFSALATESSGLPLTAALAAVNGILLLGGFLFFQFSIPRNGIVLSSLFMKLGLLVPFLVSIIFFHEAPTGLQILGFLIASGAIVIFNLKQGSEMGRFRPELLLLLTISGGVDAMAKVYESIGAASLSDLYLCLSFSVAFLLCCAIVLREKERIDTGALVYGTGIGVANFFCSKLLLAAVNQLPAVVVFPTFSEATMLIVTSVGVLFFRERLEKRQWAAFGAIIVALTLLNI